jgi:hypothetical protein
MAILCHRWWPLQESVFFALEGEPVLDAGHALYCSTYYSRAVSVARSHRGKGGRCEGGGGGLKGQGSICCISHICPLTAFDCS